MPFRLHNDSRKWFKDIQKRLGGAPLFDMYYFCLLAGLAENRLAPEAKDSETSELVDNFPGEYLSKGRLIIALFVKRELRRQGIQLSERTAVNSAIGRLVDPNSASRLSADGMKIMNRYAYAGFEVLNEWLPEPPRQLETFLPLFHRQLQAALTKNQRD